MARVPERLLTDAHKRPSRCRRRGRAECRRCRGCTRTSAALSPSLTSAGPRQCGASGRCRHAHGKRRARDVLSEETAHHVRSARAYPSNHRHVRTTRKAPPLHGTDPCISSVEQKTSTPLSPMTRYAASMTAFAAQCLGSSRPSPATDGACACGMRWPLARHPS